MPTLRLLSALLALVATTARCSAAAEPDTTPEQVQAYATYRADLRRQLLSSNDPVEWALVEDAAGESRFQILQRAAQAAPDNALVQWLYASNGSADAADDQGAGRLRDLTRLESDNGAVWMLHLGVAIRQHDSVGIDAALQHFAAASTFDTHYFDVVHAAYAIYQAHPIPAGANDTHPPQVVALEQAIAQAMVLGVPSYQTLSRSCDPKVDPTYAQHAAACLAAGRLMAHHATTLTDRMIGLSVVRYAGPLNADDAALAHEIHGLMLESVHAECDREAHPDATVHDWIGGRDELEIRRLATARERAEAERAAAAGGPLPACADVRLEPVIIAPRHAD